MYQTKLKCVEKPVGAQKAGLTMRLNQPNDPDIYMHLSRNPGSRVYGCLIDAFDLNAGMVVCSMLVFIAAANKSEAEYAARKRASRNSVVGLLDYINVKTTALP